MAKGFRQFTEEDPTLLEKASYEDFTKKKSVTPTNDDVTVQKAYSFYREKRDELEKV